MDRRKRSLSVCAPFPVAKRTSKQKIKFRDPHTGSLHHCLSIDGGEKPGDTRLPSIAANKQHADREFRSDPLSFHPLIQHTPFRRNREGLRDGISSFSFSNAFRSMPKRIRPSSRRTNRVYWDSVRL